MNRTVSNNRTLQTNKSTGSVVREKEKKKKILKNNGKMNNDGRRGSMIPMDDSSDRLNLILHFMKLMHVVQKSGVVFSSVINICRNNT